VAARQQKKAAFAAAKSSGKAYSSKPNYGDGTSKKVAKPSGKAAAAAAKPSGKPWSSKPDYTDAAKTKHSKPECCEDADLSSGDDDDEETDDDDEAEAQSYSRTHSSSQEVRTSACLRLSVVGVFWHALLVYVLVLSVLHSVTQEGRSGSIYSGATGGAEDADYVSLCCYNFAFQGVCLADKALTVPTAVVGGSAYHRGICISQEGCQVRAQEDQADCQQWQGC